MARAGIIHFRPEETAQLPQAIRNRGFVADHSESPHRRDITRAIQERITEVVVIDLTRLPSHGKEIAVWLRGRKATQHVPLIFVDGEPEKVAKVRELLPHAAFVTRDGLSAVLGTATDDAEAVIDPPHGYLKVLGDLPEGSEFLKDPDSIEPVTVWFIHEPETFLAALPRKRTIAPKTKLRVLWRKCRQNGFTQNFVREASLAFASKKS
jgi:hypothetical protein